MTRVVVTGMGVVAPNGWGLDAFADALRTGRSGVRFQEQMRDSKFECQVAGTPELPADVTERYFPSNKRIALNTGMIYAGIAAVDCWRDAGFCYSKEESSNVHWDTGAVIGTGVGGLDTAGDVLVPMTNAERVKRMGSTIVERVMMSSASAFVAGLLGLGGQVTANSSACATGTEAVILACRHIREGRAARMLAGSTEGASRYVWAGFEAMRVLSRQFNHEPERASRPMSASAGGFVPGAGAGILMLEDLESARDRGARVYAEVIGENLNCGGQRGEGSITASNPQGMRRGIESAVLDAGIAPASIDYINGHLTATIGDMKEIRTMRRALCIDDQDFPWINSTKSMIGHTLGASGSIECVATILQMTRGFVHPSINCEDLHPGMEGLEECVPRRAIDCDVDVALKTSFGFGDVNACLVLRRWRGNEGLQNNGN